MSLPPSSVNAFNQSKGEKIVTLHDGRQVSNWSEDWRAECEARHWVNYPPSEREYWMQKVEKLRGAESAHALRGLIAKLEPKHVLGLPTKDLRNDYIAQVREHRGERAADDLEERVVKLWQRLRAERVA